MELLPLWLRVALWWAAALGACVAAFWPPGKDRWGWVLLSVPVSLRVVSYTVGALFGWVDFTWALSWLALLAIVVLLAYWPEPAPTDVCR